MLHKFIATFVILSTASLSISLGATAETYVGTPITDKCSEVIQRSKSDMESKSIQPSEKVTIDTAAIKVWAEEVGVLQLRSIRN
ncbi:hypothetical protein TUMEXPCC7403_06240 [Tumidithrix helvetica PCC 7403]|uniref:hypothetical protein n=1 Tax=Tumidithrix helvetica TaxID=3457545 RepID=UPI003CACE2F1